MKKNLLLLSVMLLPAVLSAQVVSQPDRVSGQPARSVERPAERQPAVAAAPQQPVAESQPAPAPLKFACFSYKKAFEAMPEYPGAMRQLEILKSKYDEECRRVESEFNSKYEAFLEGQADFPPTILQKRQSELQELMMKNIDFKEESKRLLKQAEDDLMAPLRKRLAIVIRAVGDQRGYAFILNTDGDSCPYVNPALGTDVTQLIINSCR